MATYSELKDPDSTVNWTIDYSDWLDGDTISTSSWSVTESSESPTSLTVSSSSISSDTETSPNLSNAWTNVTVTGGAAGQVYVLTNEIVSASGFTENRSILVRIWER